MKKMITLLVLIISTYTFGASRDMSEKALNQASDYQSKIRKIQSELTLRNKQVTAATITIKDMANGYSEISSNYRKLASDVQYLKFQNDQLVRELKKTNSFTPELAKRVEGFKGRVPASVKSNK